MAILAALVVVALPLGGAADAVHGSFTASQVRSSGRSELRAPLFALVEEHRNTPQQAGRPPAGFTLTADAVRVETDHADVAVPSTYNHFPETERREFGASTVTGLRNADGYRLLLVPHAGFLGAAVAGPCLDLRASDADELTRIPLVQTQEGRPPLRVATGSALLAHGCEPAVATVQGDFLLVLYGWPAELASGGQTTHLPSGSRSLAPQGGPDSSGAAGPVEEQYLYVSNGTLRLPLAPTARLYLGHAELRSDGRAELRDADGTLSGAAGATSLNARSLVLAGTVDALLAGGGTGAPLLTRWAGTADLEADGAPVPLATGSVTGGAWPWPWLLGGLGLVGVPLLAPRLRRRRGAAARAHRVDDLLFRGADLAASGQPEAARRLTAKAVHLDPNNPEVHFIHAGTLRRLHDYRTALHHHFQAAELMGRDTDPDLVAENAFQIALALARQPGTAAGEVVKWLRHATQTNPDLWDDVVGHDELEPYLPELERSLKPPPPPDFDAAFA